ncbi:YeiH family protein [Acidobacteriota bacterium]
MRKKFLTILFGRETVLSILPGTLLGIAVMLAAKALSDYIGLFSKNQLNMSHSPVSMFLLAIILGMLTRNMIRLPAIFDPGIEFCVKKLLRLGIILLGIRLSIMAVGKIGIISLLVASLCVLSGLVSAYYLARLAGVGSRLGTLIASGTSICGVTAIIAVSPCIEAREEETTYAISTITIFGLLVTLIYPYAIELVLHLTPAQAGIFLGTAIHDTSQVTGAAFIYDQLWRTEISQIAITTKLIRNILMTVVIPILAMLHAKDKENCCHSRTKSLWSYFPKFVLGFLTLAIFRSIGDFFTGQGSDGFLFWTSAESWGSFCLTVKDMAMYILAVAISGAGLCTRFDKLKKLSYKPFLIGLAAAVIVGCVSFFLVVLLKAPIGSLGGL